MAQGNDWAVEGVGEGNGAGIDMQRVLWGRLWLLLLFTLAGAGAGYMQFTRTPPIYQSSARALLVQQQQTLPIEGFGDFGKKSDPVNTHIALMRTPVILKKAVEQLSEEDLAVFQNRNPMHAIAGGLSVYRSNASDDILELSYTSGNRQQCQVALNAVMAGYISFLAETQQLSSEESISLIIEAKDDLAQRLDDKEEAYQEFRESASLLWNGDKGTNLHQSRLAEIEAERANLLIRDSQIRAELSAIEAALENGTPREVLLLVADQTLQRRGSGGVEAASGGLTPFGMLPLLLEEALLLDKLGTGHPKVREIQRKIEVTRELLKSKAGEETGPETRLSTKPQDLVALYMESLREELRIDQQKLRELDKLFAEERRNARLLGSEENRDRALREDIERTKRLFDVIVDQLQEVSLVKEAGLLTAEIIAPPGPGYQIGPNFERIVGVAAILGLLVGAGLSLLIEVADRSFRTPEEITQRLRLPVLGHVPVLFDGRRVSRIVKDNILHTSLATYHRPKSRVAEAYRQVRTSILFGAKSESHRVLQVTSPDPGDGKSTLCANVAIAMANSGKRVLLIDADLRKPKQHMLFGASRKVGVSSIILGEMDIPDATQETGVENLHILTAGPRTEHPGEIVLSPRFDEMLAIVREQYDLVLVDTPPILIVSDPASIAKKVDGVVVVVRINQRSRTHAMQAKETLEMLGANILGLVVNGVAPSSRYNYVSGGYRYDNSGYAGDDVEGHRDSGHSSGVEIPIRPASIAKPSRKSIS